MHIFAGSEQVRIYKMKYIKDEKDIYPKLNNIQEFGKNNVAYNPIIIGWGKHQGEKCLQKYAFEHRPTDVIQGDFNGCSPYFFTISFFIYCLDL